MKENYDIYKVGAPLSSYGHCVQPRDESRC